MSDTVRQCCSRSRCILRSSTKALAIIHAASCSSGVTAITAPLTRTTVNDSIDGVLIDSAQFVTLLRLPVGEIRQ